MRAFSGKRLNFALYDFQTLIERVILSKGIPSDDITRQGGYCPKQTHGVGVVVYLWRRCFTCSWEVVVVLVVVESLPRCREQTKIIPDCQLTPLGSLSGTAPPRSSKAHVVWWGDMNQRGQREWKKKLRSRKFSHWEATEGQCIDSSLAFDLYITGWRRGNIPPFLDHFGKNEVIIQVRRMFDAITEKCNYDLTNFKNEIEWKLLRNQISRIWRKPSLYCLQNNHIFENVNYTFVSNF